VTVAITRPANNPTAAVAPVTASAQPGLPFTIPPAGVGLSVNQRVDRGPMMRLMRNGDAAGAGSDIKAVSAATYTAAADHFDDPGSGSRAVTRNPPSGSGAACSRPP
jgi:hypothetical protein